MAVEVVVKDPDNGRYPHVGAPIANGVTSIDNLVIAPNPAGLPSTVWLSGKRHVIEPKVAKNFVTNRGRKVTLLGS